MLFFFFSSRRRHTRLTCDWSSDVCSSDLTGHFAERFKRAGEAWDVALQIAALREKAGLSQKDLARKLKTSQQQISRIESPSYEGHSLSMLRRVARELNARVRVVLEPDNPADHVAEAPAGYRIARR